MLIQIMQFNIASELMTYTPVSTLVHVSSKRAQEDSVSQSQVAGNLDFAFEWYQCYWICLQRRKSRRRSTCLRVERTSIRTSLYCLSQYFQSKKPSFHSYNSPMDTHSIRISKYWFSVMQCQHILIQELENSDAWGLNQKFIVWYQYCMLNSY